MIGDDMSDFVELKTNRGLMIFNLDEIAYVQSMGEGTEAILHLKNDLPFTIEEDYASVSAQIIWISMGCPDIDDEEVSSDPSKN